ncbi:MAG: B3/B4 domain-containing protein [Conexivisphaera sp.]|jgi:DNA/RNA-binding domain of Phe-tRNA-synthetase-like protein|nr:phenylalanine--tRNA ligase beta subunit-related protein [Conexivisphaerales archaeon]
MDLEISGDVSSRFPGLRVRLVEIRSVRADPVNEGLESFKEEVYGRIRSAHSMETIRDDPVFRAYRDFYWSLGIDPTKTRPASEALVRRIVAGKGLPRINTLVDSYNLASAMSGIPLAAFDSDRLSGDALRMRFSRPGEEFLGIGMGSPRELTGREIVVEDGAGLVAIYPYRDADRTKVTGSTRNVLIMVCGAPGIPDAALEEAEALARRIISDYSA